jgi:hypothetical protein
MTKYQIRLRNQTKKYCRDVDNFRTVLKDTNNRVAHVLNGEYNCMGYAFGIFDWLDCHHFHNLEYRLEVEREENDLPEFDPNEATDEEYEALEDMTRDVAIELLDRFPIRLIGDVAEARPTERVIAMRCGFDDFHFARLNSDGVWTHKPGGNTIRIMEEDELYGNAWCPGRWCPYVSSVYFFAIEAHLDLERDYWD